MGTWGPGKENRPIPRFDGRTVTAVPLPEDTNPGVQIIKRKEGETGPEGTV